MATIQILIFHRLSQLRYVTLKDNMKILEFTPQKRMLLITYVFQTSNFSTLLAISFTYPMLLCQITNQWAEQPFLGICVLFKKWNKGLYNKKFLTVDKHWPEGKFPLGAQIKSFYSCLFNELTEGNTFQVISPDVMVPVHKFFTFLLFAKVTPTAKIKLNWQEPRWNESSLLFSSRTFAGPLYEVKMHQKNKLEMAPPVLLKITEWLWLYLNLHKYIKLDKIKIKLEYT